MTLPAGFDLDDFVRRTLAEDLGTGGDVTSNATIPADAHFVAEMNARQEIVVAGIEIAAAFFRALDPEVRVEELTEDGSRVAPGTVLMRLDGNARAMLTAERSALNTLQHLSGIATLTRTYVDAIAGTGTVLIDTRKTIPGLRALEKYAVRMGGAQNHRMRLDDGVLIKDNHVAVCGGVAEAVRSAKAANTGLAVQVEVDRIAQIEPALEALRGVISQTPPQYAALKVGGRTAYSRARSGEKVALAARTVQVFRLDMIEVSSQDVRLLVVCSSGTYVRSIARDLGRALGSAAHLAALRRLAVGALEARDALTPDQLRARGRAATSILRPANEDLLTLDPRFLEVSAGTIVGAGESV